VVSDWRPHVSCEHRQAELTSTGADAPCVLPFLGWRLGGGWIRSAPAVTNGIERGAEYAWRFAVVESGDGAETRKRC
jgi:hypothetical protein